MIATLRARVFSDSGLYAALFLFLAAQTAAGSAQHAHDALVRGGQGNPAWLPWTLAGTPELLAILATLEYRHRRKTYGPTADVRVPITIIVGSALVLMGAQLVTAQPTTLGVFAAAWPALAFLVALALVESRPRPAPKTKRTPHVAVSREGVRESSSVPPDSDGEGDGIPADIPAALAALDGNARAVYAALEQAGPGVPLTPTEIRGRTGFDRNRVYRATKALLSAELVAVTQDGRYAARKIEAVA
jgi:hypothetical protein